MNNSDRRNNQISHDRRQSGHRHSGQHVVVPAPPVLNGQFVNVNVLTPPAKTKGERENVGGRRAGQPRREGGRRLSEVEMEG